MGRIECARNDFCVSSLTVLCSPPTNNIMYYDQEEEWVGLSVHGMTSVCLV